MTRLAPRTPLLSVLSLAVAVALAGCSSSSDDSPSDLQNDPEQPGDVVEPNDVVEQSDAAEPGDVIQPGDAADPNDMVEPGDVAEPGDAVEPNDTIEPGDMTEPGDVAEPSNTAELGNETVSPTVPDQGEALPPQVQARLTTLFQVAGGDVLEVGYALGERLDTLVQNEELDQVSTITGEFGTPGVRYACPQGGTLDVTRRTTGRGPSVDLVAASCATGPLIANGTLSGSTNFGRSTPLENTRSWNFQDYALSDSRNGGSEASLALGTATLPVGGVDAISNVSERPNLLATGLGLTAGRDGSYSATSVTVNGRNTVESDPSAQRGLTFRADTLRSSQFADAQVLTTTPFVRDDRSENYRTGALQVTGTSGFVYDLNADNGDPASFQLDVTENGSTTSYTVPWSAAFSFDRFDPNTVDLGF